MGWAIPFGILDITLYRDDLTTVSNRPMLRETLIDFDINNLALVLVDDTPVSLAPLGMFAVFSSLMLWAWSSAYSLVPISIASSSVLRI